MDHSNEVRKLLKEVQDLRKQKSKGLKFRDDIMAVLSTAGHGIWLWNNESNLFQIGDNDTFWKDDLDYLPGDYDNEMDQWFQKLHPISQQAYTKAIDLYFSGETEFFELEYQIKTKSGDWAWFWKRGIATSFDKNGIPESMLGIYNNTTEKNKTLKELRESEKKHREILEGLNDTAFRMSIPDGKYEYMSKAAKNVFGYSSEKWLNNPMLIRDIIHPDYVTYFTEKWADLLNGKMPKTYEYKVIDPDGQERWILQSNTGIYDGKSKLIAIEGLCRNITERKKAEQQIKAALKEKETLLYEIHHRVKNNMQVISSLLKLQSNSIEDEQVKNILKDSQSRVYAMSAVHETLYRSENLSKINLRIFISKVTSAIFQMYSIDTNKITQKINLDDLAISLSQAYPLGLIINELISNSLKYAFPDERKGEINLNMIKLEKELELNIMDSGVGMPEGFDWKNNDSLGLQLVRTLVENQLDGSINMESHNGTRFIIKFNIESKYK